MCVRVLLSRQEQHSRCKRWIDAVSTNIPKRFTISNSESFLLTGQYCCAVAATKAEALRRFPSEWIEVMSSYVSAIRSMGQSFSEASSSFQLRPANAQIQDLQIRLSVMRGCLLGRDRAHLAQIATTRL